MKLGLLTTMKKINMAKKKKKKKKLMQFGQKQITQILSVHNVFFWMIMLIIPKMTTIDIFSLN